MYDYTKIIGPHNDASFRKESDTKNAIPSDYLSNLHNTRNFRELFLYEFINSIFEKKV